MNIFQNNFKPVNSNFKRHKKKNHSFTFKQPNFSQKYEVTFTGKKYFKEKFGI